MSPSSGNDCNKRTTSPFSAAPAALQGIWMAETKAAAELAFDAFIESYTPKYAKAADCLAKDRDTLLAFYDFPAEHWKHLRTTNPIESTFATVRHRTIRSNGCPSSRTALAMVFKLLEAAQKSWRRLVPNPVVTGLSPVTPDDISKTWSRACIGRRRPGNTVGNSEHHPYGPLPHTPFRNKRTSDPRCLTDPRGHRARPAAPARSAAGWIRHEPKAAEAEDHRKLSSRNAHPRRDAYLRVDPMATTEKPTAVC